MAKGIRKEVWYEDPPERVWVALTDPHALAEWLMPNDFKPILGHRFRFQTGPMKGMEEKTECEVLEIDPPRRMVWRWTIVWKQPLGAAQPMTVAWTLTPDRGGTRLVLEQSAYSGPRSLFTRLSMGMGWGWMMKRQITKVLRNVGADGRFTPGAVPPGKRCYKVRGVPEDLAV